TPLAAGDCAGQADRSRPREGGLEALTVADVHSVDIDVHEPSQLAALVEDEIRDRKRAQGFCDRPGVKLEAALPAGFGREHPGEEDYGHTAASTERIVGSCEAASLQLCPPSAEAKTDPLCVPR